MLETRVPAESTYPACAVSGHRHTGSWGQSHSCREESRNRMCAAGTRTMHVGKRPGTICVLKGLGPCMHV